MDMINRGSLASVPNSYWVEQYEALERLERNDDFKKVILDGYFKDKAIKGVSLLAREDVKSAGVRPDVYESLIAVSALQDHFLTIKAMGKIDYSDLDELDEADADMVKGE